MYAGPVKEYQTSMLVGTSLQNDMTAGYMQLLKTWEMPDAINTDLADDLVQM